MPKYNDPNDKRMARIITPSLHAQPRAVNILGIPFDGAVLGRKGASGGPGAIREAMAGFSNYSIELGVNLERARVFDLGDLVVSNEDVLRAHAQIETEVGGDIKTNSLMVILGGDNSVSLPSIRACARKFGRLGLIAIDSHLDLRDELQGKPTSGSSYGLAIANLEELDGRRVVELGAHGFLNSRKYVDRAKRLGISLWTAEKVRERGPHSVAREAYRIASRGADAVYLSLDLDAVDLAQVSGVSAPSAGGLTADEVFRLVYELARNPGVKCADIVELAPSLDPTGRSERVAATALMFLIAGFASRKHR
jgi:formiminoglutamase